MVKLGAHARAGAAPGKTSGIEAIEASVSETDGRSEYSPIVASVVVVIPRIARETAKIQTALFTIRRLLTFQLKFLQTFP
jgi:hypothetical protein